MVPLLSGDNWGNDVRVQGFECGPDTDCNSRFNEVGRRLLQDVRHAAARRARVHRRRSVTGAREGRDRQRGVRRRSSTSGATRSASSWATATNDSLDIQIVGLVPNVEVQRCEGRDAAPVFYLPWTRRTRVGQHVFYARTSPAAATSSSPHVPADDEAASTRTCRSRI